MARYDGYAWGSGADKKYTEHHPQVCPKEWLDDIQKIQTSALQALELYKVPWYIVHMLALSHYVTVGDIADRFTETLTYTKATAERLMLKEAEYTEEEADRILGRLKRAAVACRKHEENSDKAERMRSAVGGMDQAEQKDLRETWRIREGHKFPLEYEGSEVYIAKQLRETQKGQLGNFTNKQIIGRLPDPTIKDSSSQVPTGSGVVDIKDQTKQAPNTEERWIYQMRVFYYTLTLCIHSSSAYAVFQEWNLECAKQYWEHFLMGPLILKRKDSPSLRTVMIAERKAWSEICLDIYRTDCTLKKAVENIMNNGLWWSNEIAAGEKAAKNKKEGDNDGKGKNKGRKGWSDKGKHSKGDGNFVGKGKGGKGGGKGKQSKGNGKNDGNKGGKNSGKGKKDGNTGKGSKRGNTYCWNFHYGSGCQGRCGYSHQCPVCGQTHRQLDFHN